MPDTYRDRKRQQAWAKAEAKRVIAQEQADALTALGVPTAVRSGWVVLLAPDDLAVQVQVLKTVEDAMRAVAQTSVDLVTVWEQQPELVREVLMANPAGVVHPQTPAAEATLPAAEPVGPVPNAGERQNDPRSERQVNRFTADAWYESTEPPAGHPLTLTIPEAGLQVPPL